MTRRGAGRQPSQAWRVGLRLAGVGIAAIALLLVAGMLAGYFLRCTLGLRLATRPPLAEASLR